MALDYSHPEVVDPPEHPPICCAQQTITVRVEIAEAAQSQDYASAAWRRSSNRRTASERTFAWLQDPPPSACAGGWCRLMGTTKNALMLPSALW